MRVDAISRNTASQVIMKFTSGLLLIQAGFLGHGDAVISGGRKLPGASVGLRGLNMHEKNSNNRCAPPDTTGHGHDLKLICHTSLNAGNVSRLDSHLSSVVGTGT